MISRRWHSRTAGLLALVYVLATTVGGLFHDHSAHDHGAHEHVAHDHGSDQHGSHELCLHAHIPSADAGVVDDLPLAAAFDSAALTPDARPAVSALPSADDDCVVCRFLAQKTSPVQVVTLHVSCDFVASLPAPAAIGPVAPVARTLHSRAPPALA